MSDTDSVPRADGLNTAETKGEPRDTQEGGRPIRKRGYHRALRRGEQWAKNQKTRTECELSYRLALKKIYLEMVEINELYRSNRGLD